MYNQIANYVYMQSEINIKVGNKPPEEYFNKILDEIKSYNEDDVDSTRQLDDWIRAQAAKLNHDQYVSPMTEVLLGEISVTEHEEPIAVQLLEGVPLDPSERTPEQQGLALLSAAVSFHKREARPAWWAIYDRAITEIDDMELFNDVVIPTKVDLGPWIKTGKQRNHHREISIEAEGFDLSLMLEYENKPNLLYELAPNGFKEIQGSARAFADASIIDIDGSKAILEEKEKKGGGTWDSPPIAILPGSPISTTTIEQVLRETLGESTLYRKVNSEEIFPNFAWCDVLLRRPPRQLQGRPLVNSGDPVADITASLLDSDSSYIAVQGPPGTGKTYVGAHVIVNLVKMGWKIGVVAQSHAVVEHLMSNVAKIDSSIEMAKKPQSERSNLSYHVDDISSWAAARGGTGYLVGGTIWSFSGGNVRLLGLDLIVIDEAGQFSLANSLVAISAARCALLLGDPQQLPQVSQGKHPEPVNESVLSHLLGSKKTMPTELGYFLEKTFRLHPLIASAVSRLQYEDRLTADPRCSNRMLEGVAPGIHVINVEHLGNTVTSLEEADEILTRIPLLLGKAWTPVNSSGQVDTTRPLVESDILIVTGYNAQVRYLKSRLAAKGFHGIRVGTVDKFQGQEAPIVFVSMVTSSREDLPRGIEFLLSPNRLNVAISRAQWACFVIRSPHLAVMEPTSPEGMVMLGKFVTLCNGRESVSMDL